MPTQDRTPVARPRRVLVTAGSKHGATAQIAQHVGEILRKRGVEATVADPSDVDTVDGYGAVVLGSAVYAGRWLQEARRVAVLISETVPQPAVWMFSSGPVGDPPKPDGEPVDVAEIIEMVRPRDHRVFAGRIDKSTLGFGERALVAALRVREGDFRNWDQITAWADVIAHELRPQAPPGTTL